MVATRVFSGDVVASGDDLTQSDTTVLKIDDPHYDPDGCYIFTFWRANTNSRASSHVFRLSDIKHRRFCVIRRDSVASYNVFELDVTSAGLVAQRGNNAESDNKWTLIRLS